MSEGKGHPLPASGEARHNEVPESDERAKGRGDDFPAFVTPGPDAVNPDGEPYRYGDLGRGAPADELEDDQRAHQDRGQSAAEDGA